MASLVTLTVRFCPLMTTPKQPSSIATTTTTTCLNVKPLLLSLKTTTPKFIHSIPNHLPFTKLNGRVIATNAIPSELGVLKFELSDNDDELAIETQRTLERISDQTEKVKQMGSNVEQMERELNSLINELKEIKIEDQEAERAKEIAKEREERKKARQLAKQQGKNYKPIPKKEKEKLDKEKAKRRMRRSLKKNTQVSKLSSRFQSSEHAYKVISSSLHNLVTIASMIPEYKTLVEQIGKMGADIDQVEESLMEEISKVSKHIRNMREAGGWYPVNRPIMKLVFKAEKLLVRFYGPRIECLKSTKQLYDERGDPEKIIYYGTRALKFYIDHYNMYGTQASAMRIATTLHILGYASRVLYRYDESSSYLNLSVQNLSKLEWEASFPAELVSSKLHDAHSELALVETALGSGDEIVTQTRDILETHEKTMEERSVEIGWANYALADAYLRVGNFNEALPYALKALEIYSGRLFGVDSVKLAQLKRSFGILSYQLKKYENVVPSDLLREEMETGNDFLVLDKLEQGIGFMKTAAIFHATLEDANFMRASAWVASARTMLNLNKFAEAKKYMKYAHTIVERNI